MASIFKPSARRYLIDARMGIVGGLALAAATFAAKLLFSLPAWILIVGMLSVVAIGYLALGAKRQRQRRQASILQEPSASASAFDLVLLTQQSLENGRNPVQISAEITTVTELRRYPATLLLQPVLELLKRADFDERTRQKAVRWCEAILRERKYAREKVIDETTTFLSQLNKTTDFVVVYGYSSTVCDSIVNLNDKNLVILVVEDLQYGAASVREHELVREVLAAAGVACHIIPFRELDQLFHEPLASVPSLGGGWINLSPKRKLIALLGCDAISLDGSVLIPAIVAGTPSNSACLADTFLHQGSTLSPGSRQLVVVGESYKIGSPDAVEEAGTSAPLRPTRWLRQMHRFGLAVPYRAAPTSLYRIKGGWTSLLTDAGSIAPGDRVTDDLRAARQTWFDRVAE